MNKVDSYLLLMIGLLVVALMAVELMPLYGISIVAEEKEPLPSELAYEPPELSSVTLARVKVIPTSALATVTVTGG